MNRLVQAEPVNNPHERPAAISLIIPACALQNDMATRTQRWQRYRAGLSLFSRFVLSCTTSRLFAIRNDFASRYISGEGYEIGAQKSPLICKNAQKILYIDYMSKEESARKYKLPEQDCVEVDIIADANDLSTLPAGSASFVIANHVLEHSPNPIGALLGWLRLLANGGILFLTLPNHNGNEFDFEKVPPDLAHFIRDYEQDRLNEDITSEHISEHITLIDGIDPDETERFEMRRRELVASNLHTHYHVFNRANALSLLNAVHGQSPIRLINSLTPFNGFELIFIIEKAAAGTQGVMPVKQDSAFNLGVLLKNFSICLFNRYASRRA